MGMLSSRIQLLCISIMLFLLAACGGGSGSVKGSSAISSIGASSSIPASSLSVQSSFSSLDVSSSHTSSNLQSSSSLNSSIAVKVSIVGRGKIGVEDTVLLQIGQQLEIPIEPDEGFRIAAVDGCPGRYTLKGFITEALVEGCELLVKFDVDVVEPVTDPALKKQIKTALGLADSETLTARKMWLLEKPYPINLDETTNVFDLRGLEYAKNLSYLRVPNLLDSKSTNPSVLDLTPLTELTNLEELQISNIHIKDLTPLRNLTKLNWLAIEGSNVVDINPIAKLTKLDVIHLSFNNISDISVLQGFDNLRSLSLGGNKIDSNMLAVLKGKKIKALSVEFSLVEDLEFLRGNSILDGLNIRGTLVNSLSPLLDTGLGQGSNIFVQNTCLIYNNNPYLSVTRKALIARGIKIEETPVDFAYEAEGNPYKEMERCPARDALVTTAIHASYGTDGSLSVDWKFAGDVADDTLSCAIYAGIELQQLREPLVRIDSCPLLGKKIINGFAYANEDLHFVVSNGVDIHKNILVKPVSSGNVGPVIQSIDWGQSVISANPRLVQNRDALLRVHVIAAAPSPVPDVNVELILGEQSKILTMLKPSQLPNTKRYRTLSSSYLLVVPKEWVRPGLSLKVSLPDEAPRVLQPVVNEKTTLSLTVVPIDILGEVAELPAEAVIRSILKDFWPLSDVVTRVHPVYKSKVTTGEGMWSLLSELEELRALENNDTYYYGFFSNKLYPRLNNIPYGGIGYIDGSSALGLDSTGVNGYLQSWASTMLHEIGHNFGLSHVNCGNPYPFDSAYPYPAGTIGSLGVSADLKDLYEPEPYDKGGYADIMSYCWPQHVSDYSYTKVQDYLELHPPKEFASISLLDSKRKITGAEEVKSIYISGEISSSGVVALRRIIPVQQLRDPEIVGDYKIRVVSKKAEQIDQSFNVNELDHAAKNTPLFFSVKIPFVEIASVEIFYKGRSIFKQLDQFVVGASQKQSSAIDLNPVLRETGSSVCVDWSARQYESASLLLQQGEVASVIFIDDVSGKLCAPIVGLPAGGEWKLMLRNNLHVEEVDFAR